MPRLLTPVVASGSLGRHAQPTLPIDDQVAMRPFQAEDAATLVDAYADPDIAFWHHRSMSHDEARAWVQATADAWHQEHDAEWAIVDTDQVLGRVALRGISLDIGHAEVSYWTLPHARDRAVASRGVDRLARWALHEVGFWRLLIRHSTRNVASCRVAGRAGFAHEATLTRCHIHADGWHDVHVHTRFRSPPPAGSPTAST